MDPTGSQYFSSLLDEIDSRLGSAALCATGTYVLSGDLIACGKIPEETGLTASAPVSLDFDLESGSALLFTPKTTFDPSELIVRKPQTDSDDIPPPSKPFSRFHPFIPVSQISVNFVQTPFIVPLLEGAGMEELEFSAVGYSEIEKKANMKSSEEASQGAKTASHEAKLVDRGPPSSFPDALLKSYGLWNPGRHFAQYPALRAALAGSTSRTVNARVANAVNMMIPRPPPPPPPPVHPVLSRMKVPLATKPVPKETAKLPVVKGIMFKVMGTVLTKSPPEKRKSDQVLTGSVAKKPKMIVIRRAAGKTMGLPAPPLHVALPPIEFPESVGKSTKMLPLFDNGKRIVINSRNSIAEFGKKALDPNTGASVKSKKTKKRKGSKKGSSVLKVFKNTTEKEAQPAQKQNTQQISVGKKIVVDVTRYQAEQRSRLVVVHSKMQIKRKKTDCSRGVFTKDEWEMMALASKL